LVLGLKALLWKVACRKAVAALAAIWIDWLALVPCRCVGLCLVLGFRFGIFVCWWFSFLW